ncbi:TPA: hypothetical protein ACNV1G_004557 [Citrobacter amalonaticus]
MKTVVVTLEIDVPDEATSKDISEYIDVEYAQCGSRRTDNPCIDKSELVYHTWKMSEA